MTSHSTSVRPFRQQGQLLPVTVMHLPEEEHLHPNTSLWEEGKAREGMMATKGTSPHLLTSLRSKGTREGRRGWERGARGKDSSQSQVSKEPTACSTSA